MNINIEQRKAFLDDVIEVMKSNPCLETNDRYIFAVNLGLMFLSVKENGVGSDISWARVLRESLDPSQCETLGKKRKTLMLLPGETPNHGPLRLRAEFYCKIAQTLAEIATEGVGMTPDEVRRYAISRLISGSSFYSSLTEDERFDSRWIADINKVIVSIQRKLERSVDLKFIETLLKNREINHEDGALTSWQVFDDYPPWENVRSIANIDLGYFLQKAEIYRELDHPVAIRSNDENDIRKEIIESLDLDFLGLEISEGHLISVNDTIPNLLETSLPDSEPDFMAPMLKRRLQMEYRLDPADHQWKLVVLSGVNDEPSYYQHIFVCPIVKRRNADPNRITISIEEVSEFDWIGSIVVSKMDPLLAKLKGLDQNGKGDEFLNYYEVTIVGNSFSEAYWDKRPIDSLPFESIEESWGDALTSEQTSSMRVWGYPGFNESLAQTIQPTNEFSGDLSLETSAKRGTLADLILRNITTAKLEDRIDQRLCESAIASFQYFQQLERLKMAEFEEKLNDFLSEED